MISNRTRATDGATPTIMAAVVRRATQASPLHVVAALVFVAGAAGAQQPANQPPAAGKSKAVQAIEIRGQVPTPQVVTVRPRQIPMFSREVLTPAFFDRHFWDALFLPYEIVPDLSAAAGTAPIAWTAPPLPADSSHRPPADSSVRPTGSLDMPAPNSGTPPRAKAGDEVQGSTPNAPREK